MFGGPAASHLGPHPTTKAAIAEIVNKRNIIGRA
jgi:hypothetical protein